MGKPDKIPGKNGFKYPVLSNGEQFRATLARLMAEAPDGISVVDEFSSVVDR